MTFPNIETSKYSHLNDKIISEYQSKKTYTDTAKSIIESSNINASVESFRRYVASVVNKYNSVSVSPQNAGIKKETVVFDASKYSNPSKTITMRSRDGMYLVLGCVHAPFTNIGAMADFNSVVFNYASKAQQDTWKNGFGILHVHNNKTTFQQITWDGRFVFGGKVYL